MHKLNYTTVLLLMVVSFVVSACLDEYNPPEIVNNNSILVVEGNITDTETQVRLTQTSNLGDKETLPVTNAVVRLENESGSFQFNLQPEGEGFYRAVTSLNQNDKYRIRIQTQGDEYVSEFLSLMLTPPIDNVAWENVDDKFQVHVSATGNEDFSPYYLWTFEETWLYRSRYISSVIYKDGIVTPRKDDEQITSCWSTLSSTSIQVGTTVNLGQNVVSKQPIHTIEPYQGLKLSRRYSILVKQYSISKEAFEFWSLLKKNTENVGTFFDPQPSQLPTNLTCISDPNKSVIGFLSASQEQTSERMYVNRKDLPFIDIPFSTVPGCFLDTIPPDPGSLEIAFRSGTNLMTFPIETRAGVLIGYGSSKKECVDCRLLGGTTEKPGFWID